MGQREDEAYDHRSEFGNLSRTESNNLEAPAPVPEAGEGVEPVIWVSPAALEARSKGETVFGWPRQTTAFPMPLYLHPAPTDRVAELEAALAPFIEAAKNIRPDDPDSDRICLATVADYRRALLSAQPRAKGEG